MRIPAMLSALVLASVVVFGSPVMAANSGDGNNRRVVVINATSQSIYYFYASRINIDDWQEDMLRNDVVRPGHSQTFNIDDGTGYCYYDLKVVMKNGDSAVRNRVNVCSVETWTITD